MINSCKRVGLPPYPGGSSTTGTATANRCSAACSCGPQEPGRRGAGGALRDAVAGVIGRPATLPGVAAGAVQGDSRYLITSYCD